MEVTFEIDPALLARAERALKLAARHKLLLTRLGIAAAVVLAPALPAGILVALSQWKALQVGVAIYVLVIAAIMVSARGNSAKSTRGLEGVFTMSVGARSLEVFSAFGHIYRSAAAVNDVFVVDELIVVFVDGKSGYLVVPFSAFRYVGEAQAFADEVHQLCERGLADDVDPIVPTEFASGVFQQVAWDRADHVEPPIWKLIGSLFAVGLAFLGGIFVFDPFLHVAMGVIGLIIMSASVLLAAIQVLAPPGTNQLATINYRATLTEDGLCYVSWPNQEIFRYWNTISRVKRGPQSIAIQCDIAPHIFWIPVAAFSDELAMNHFATQAERLIADASGDANAASLEASN